MNNVRSIASLNEHELKLAVDGSTRGSWHDEYKDSAVIFIGGLDPGLTEGDVVTIFSQFGEILDINLPKWTTASIASQQRRNGPTSSGDLDAEERKRQRDAQEAKQKVGKRRGFGFLLYQDQRSTILAVDNLNGSQVLGKTLRVDHVKDYKQLEKDGDTGKMKEADERTMNARPELVGGDEEDQEDSKPAQDDPDAEDPMAAYIAKSKARSGGDDDLDWLLQGDFGVASSSKIDERKSSDRRRDGDSRRGDYDDLDRPREKTSSRRYDDGDRQRLRYDDDDRERRRDRASSRRYGDDDRERREYTSRRKYEDDSDRERRREYTSRRKYECDEDGRERPSNRYQDDRSRQPREDRQTGSRHGDETDERDRRRRDDYDRREHRRGRYVDEEDRRRDRR